MVDSAARRDKRIESTRAAAYKALVELIVEKGLGCFSVTELCQRAGMNRGTFYNHWKNIDQLLIECEDELLAELEKRVRAFPDLTRDQALNYGERNIPIPAFVEVFEFFRERADFMHAVMDPEGGDRHFRPKMREFLGNVYLEKIIKERYPDADDRDAEYFAWYHSYALMGVVTRWALLGCEESSDEMAIKLFRYLLSVPG